MSKEIVLFQEWKTAETGPAFHEFAKGQERLAKAIANAWRSLVPKLERQFLHSPCAAISTPARSPLPRARSRVIGVMKKLRTGSGCSDALATVPIKASAGSDGIVPAIGDSEDGVSLGTMTLPANIDIPRFETLLFQWANSLCQGANLPLPVPLKVDKIQGGARLGFTAVEDGKTEVPVYIDCLVFPVTGASGLLFRAVRNGPLKDKPAPGEPGIMRSLMQALQKCADAARIQ